MGPLNGRPAWNNVSAPSETTQGMQNNREQKTGFAGAYKMSSVETPSRSEQAGGMRSEKFNGKMGRRNVAKSSLQSPAAEAMPKGMMDGGKY